MNTAFVKQNKKMFDTTDTSTLRCCQKTESAALCLSGKLFRYLSNCDSYIMIISYFKSKTSDKIWI